jgi:hypothetical protein
VLLCIKPKTDVSEEPTEKKVKVKKEKKNKK